jgi:thiamine biosynthesis protein ThiI
MKRGSPVVPLYVDLGEYGGADHQARAASTVAQLARYTPERDIRLRVAPAGPEIDAIVSGVEDGRMLVLRRFMFRVAAAVAREEEAVGIVTGEAIGQKSSQTTANLAATSAAVDFPVLRPLLTRDKPTITEQADRIGTFEESSIPAGCHRLAPDFPETRADPASVAAAEPDDVTERARAVAEDVRVVDPVSAPPERSD